MEAVKVCLEIGPGALGMQWAEMAFWELQMEVSKGEDETSGREAKA
jgi:hypothetical protein